MPIIYTNKKLYSDFKFSLYTRKKFGRDLVPQNADRNINMSTTNTHVASVAQSNVLKSESPVLYKIELIILF